MALSLSHSFFAFLMTMRMLQAMPPTKDINIVFIWFDDLGFGDTAFNGGDYPTPILDDLASNNAIRLNFHYSEQICSASRSALLTGRYSWLTGLHGVAKVFTEMRFNDSLTLFPSILKNEGYDTYIAGKWHIGYSHDVNLPHNNGFSQGVYTRNSAVYYSRSFERRPKQFDTLFGAPSQSVRERRRSVLNGYKIPIHDTFLIEEDMTPKEVAGFVADSSYIEDIYTENLKEFIRARDQKRPFFAYYSMLTPHSSISQPPQIRPTGATMDYSECYDRFPAASGLYGDCTVENDTRCVFCKQVHYASVGVQEIIEEIKHQKDIDWGKTIVVITSDNGGTPTTAQGYAFGSSLPYRGIKAGVHEGGIRTPAILKGGYIENILGDSCLANSLCQYDGMVHVSDWYHLFMDILGINSGTNPEYKPDADHSSLNLWDHIQCSCAANKEFPAQKYCDNNYQKRDEIVSMKMCSNHFYSTYVRRGDMKLVVNGSNSVVEECFNFTEVSDINQYSAYVTAEDQVFPTPNETYYDQLYIQSINRANLGNGRKFYESQCLEKLMKEYQDGINDHINSMDYPPFQYDESMLFNIATDRVEACSLEDAQTASKLFRYLKDRSLEYTVPTETAEYPLGAFRKLMQSFDCQSTYTMPWNGRGSGDSDDLQTKIDKIWTEFLDKFEFNCSDQVLMNQESTQSVSGKGWASWFKQMSEGDGDEQNPYNSRQSDFVLDLDAVKTFLAMLCVLVFCGTFIYFLCSGTWKHGRYDKAVADSYSDDEEDEEEEEEEEEHQRLGVERVL